MRQRNLFVIMLTALVAVVGGAGLAHANEEIKFGLVADGTKKGPIDFYMAADPNTPMRIYEVADTGKRQVASIQLDARGYGVIRDGTRWRCDRLSRRFEAHGVFMGLPATTKYTIRTGSCRHRLNVTLPRRVRRGANVRMVIRDEWGIGDLRLRLCKVEIDKTRCRGIELSRDQAELETNFRLKKEGPARIVLLGPPALHLSTPITVGNRSAAGGPTGPLPSVLAAGDSLMQGVDAYLADRLDGRARVLRDVVPNSGISKPNIDWLGRARYTATKVRPDVAVVFLGGNEGFDLKSASGQNVPYGSPTWYGEFASRVRGMMATYSRGGKADVFWLAIPAPRDPSRQGLQDVVNSAIFDAARGLPRVHILRLDEVFTPGGKYRDYMYYRGVRHKVREADGIHLTVVGAQIAADKIAAALKAARLVR